MKKPTTSFSFANSATFIWTRPLWMSDDEEDKMTRKWQTYLTGRTSGYVKTVGPVPADATERLRVMVVPLACVCLCAGPMCGEGTDAWDDANYTRTGLLVWEMPRDGAAGDMVNGRYIPRPHGDLALVPLCHRCERSFRETKSGVVLEYIYRRLQPGCLARTAPPYQRGHP